VDIYPPVFLTFRLAERRYHWVNEVSHLAALGAVPRAVTGVTEHPTTLSDDLSHCMIPG